MTIRVALNHVTRYRYDRKINIGPQTIRLRPAAHCRTPIVSYSLNVGPAEHFLNWQQDPHGNFLARATFEQKTTELSIAVDLIADMTVINPFGFFVEEAAEEIPFDYADALKLDLKPWLTIEDNGKKFDSYAEEIDQSPRRTIDFLVDINRKLSQDIKYLIRMEPGVQTCDETLTKGSGSCRDSAWLLVQLLRHCGLAARFVSGYLIQLAADQKSLDGPSGPEEDFTDLHAWTEVYLPGAGWVGLDPTSGLFAGEGHIPLACSPHPTAAAPITGTLDECEVEFDFDMSVTRVHEDPRVTKPYSETQWERISQLGKAVDRQLDDGDVRLTMGGEPTFVSIDNQDGDEWNTGAVGAHKQRLSIELVQRLRQRYAKKGLLHFGQGKWYPGESLPRWAHTCMWRTDGEPMWERTDLLAEPDCQRSDSTDVAAEFMLRLSQSLEVEPENVIAAYEDVLTIVDQEQSVPIDEDPASFDADSSEDRRRLARILSRGVTQAAGFVLPLERAWWQANAKWTSGPWPFRSGRLVLIPGDSPVGLRLPLERLPSEFRTQWIVPKDPSAPRGTLGTYTELRTRAANRIAEQEAAQIREQTRQLMDSEDESLGSVPLNYVAGPKPVTTALCVEARDGVLCVFLPPVSTLEDYLDLVAHVEATAEATNTPVILEGYLPPHDQRLKMIKVTPDPGVIEVNVHPTSGWDELVQQTEDMYADARQTRLGTEKFQVDGRHTGTGGGNHIVMGGATTPDSPFLRRPDVLRSLIGFWNDHPSLSYIFSGMFIGPTSQAPRVDEGRADALYELELAFQQIPDATEVAQPWLVDRVFRNLLVDLTGNTHRAEFCIDKLFSPDSSTGRLGLVELRAFEMPPHPRMSLAQQLLVRGLVAMFWNQPYRTSLTRWGTALHDRFMLPWFLERDLREVIGELNAYGLNFEAEWFAPHLEFRCPKMGELNVDQIQLEFRQAIEPWYVLGEEPGGGGTARYVDSSVERLQVLTTNLQTERYALSINGIEVPLHASGMANRLVAGVRYRAWQPPSCLQPTIPVNTPLVIDIVDRKHRKAIGGCQYHIDEPGGINPPGLPVNALEAESRRATRFVPMGHTNGTIEPRQVAQSDAFPFTLDMRWMHF